MSYRDITYSLTHSLQRFEERYCKTLSVEQYHILVDLVRKLIKEKRFISVKKLTNTNLQYVVNLEFENIDVIATYETERNTITTFLPNKTEKITLITTGTDDQSTINMLYDLSRLPYVKHVYGLPDLTFTTPCSVGTSVEVYKHSYFKWIGTDIGCGVTLFLLRQKRDDIEHKEIARKLHEKYLNTHIEAERRIGKIKYNITNDEFDASLVTIGGGNHFAELMIIQENMDEESELDSEYLYLCVHSGSREFGVYVQSLFEGDKPINMSNPQFNSFMEWHDKCVI